MPATHKFPLHLLLLFTALPAALIGAVLWYLSGLVPECTTDIAQRLTSPDGQFDLVTFSRACGDSGANSQAALIPAGDALPEDATSFASVGAAADLAPRWDGFGNIELTLPPGAQIYRQDAAVAGVDVIYQ